MARRRNKSDGSQGSLDSLLDTMTNVVGVLIMVLIVTQVNVSSVAKRIRANLPDVSKAQMASLVTKDEAIRKRIEELENPQNVSPQDLKDARAELDELLTERDAAREDALAVVDLEQSVEDLELEVRGLQRRIGQDEAELARIRRELKDGQAALGERKMKRIRLPNPRVPEEGSQEERVIVRKGRVLYFDRKGLLDRVAGKVKAKKNLPKVGNRFQREKLKGFLDGLRDSEPDFRLEFVIHPNGSIRMSCYPRDDRGEDIDQIRAKKGRALEKIGQAFGENAHIRFYVTADSFDLYLAARDLADRVQIPSGWLFVDDTARQDTSLGERGIVATVKEGWEPPKPNPNAPKPPPKPVVEDILD